MATIKIPRVAAFKNKDGTMRYYERITTLADGKQKVRYRRLPDLTAPNFHAALNASAAPVAERHLPADGTVAALIREFRLVLPTRGGQKGPKMAKSSLANWEGTLREIEAEHGHKPVASLRTSHLLKIRDSMAATPGKANTHMSHWKVLLNHAASRDWIAANPAIGIDRMSLGERAAWPGEVITEVLGVADPVLRLGIVSALCSGLRISDLIRMREDWIRPGEPPILVAPPSVKTNTEAYVPMGETWLEEIAAMRALNASRTVRPTTLLHLKNGEPFKTPAELQARLRVIMTRLGHVERDEQGRPIDREGNLVTEDSGTSPKLLYNFHGLSKNAICYLADECDLDDNQISAIVGKTVETVRDYSKQKRKWMIAKNAADKVVRGDFGKLVAGKINMEKQRRK